MRTQTSIRYYVVYEDRSFYVMSPDLPGIMVDMPTLDEALEEFRMVAAEVIQAAIEEGKPLYLRGEQLLY